MMFLSLKISTCLCSARTSARITSDRLMELHFGVANEGSGIWPKIVSET